MMNDFNAETEISLSPKSYTQSIQIGHATFLPIKSQAQTLLSLDEQDMQLFNNDIWLLNQDYGHKWKYFQIRHKSQCHKLVITASALQQQLFKPITPIVFDQLILLDLCFNQITNIEPLQFFYAPKLKTLSLVKNHFVNLSSTLGKLTFPQLQKIQTGDNQFSQIKVGRWKMGKKINECGIYNTGRVLPVDDMNFYAKMQRNILDRYLAHFIHVGFHPKQKQTFSERIPQYRVSMALWDKIF